MEVSVHYEAWLAGNWVKETVMFPLAIIIYVLKIAGEDFV
jgi:hypothetical protein